MSSTVLIVEDSPTQAKQIANQLAQYKISVLIATDGPEALRMVDERCPDLIVLDVNLPTMSGYQVCSRLKRDPDTAHIPVIMLTSSDNSDSMLAGLNAGAMDYIPKDVYAAKNLLETLRSIGLIE